MIILLGWLTFAFLAGMIGSNRKIGFWGTFLLSIFLSPLVGFIVALVSAPKEQPAKPAAKPPASLADELNKLKTLLEGGHITQEEYEAAKKKLLG